MPTASVNGIDINYSIEGDGPRPSSSSTASPTICRPGAPDARPARRRLPRAAVRQSRHRPADRPAGPYTLEAARRRRQGAGRQPRHHRLPPDGRVHGRHDRRGVRHRLSRRPQVADARLHLRHARSVLPAMFAMWADMAPVTASPSSCATSRCGPSPGRSSRSDPATPPSSRRRWRRSTMSVDAYLAQLAVIQTHDATDRLGAITVPDARARGRGGHPHPGAALRAAAAGHPRRQWKTDPGGHACMWEHPDAVQRRRSSTHPARH